MAVAFFCFLYLISTLAFQTNAVCEHNSICTSARDTITHSDIAVSNADKEVNTHRSWKIQPNTTRGNILLAFKNFQTDDSAIVEVNIAHFDGDVETKFYSGNLGNFETIAKHAWYIAINVSLAIGKMNFSLNYYADCEISSESPIQSFRDDEAMKKCYIIIPNVEGFINRVYTTMRRIHLPPGMIMKVQDIHTSAVVATIEGTRYLEPVGTQAAVMTGGINSYFILVDFICEQEECDYASKEYTISHYEMREKDIWCIEVFKMCSDNDDIPVAWCNVQCTALTAMVEQEYLLEQQELISPTPDFQQQEDTLSVKKAAIKCPKQVHPKFCQCDRRLSVQEICSENNKRKCISYGPCAWDCIVTKVMRCIHVKLLKAIVLL